MSRTHRDHSQFWVCLRLLGSLHARRAKTCVWSAATRQRTEREKGTYDHVEGRLRDGVGEGLGGPDAGGDAADGARDVHDRLLAALRDERGERLGDQRGPDDVRLERLHEAGRVELQRGVVSAGVLSIYVSYGKRKREDGRGNSQYRRC